MKARKLGVAILILWSIQSTGVSALTTREFFSICEFTPSECGKHPALQAYLGGALDLLATLDEQGYLDKMYCKKPKALFDIPAIIHFMHIHIDEYSSRNAMLPVIRYLEEKGAC